MRRLVAGPHGRHANGAIAILLAAVVAGCVQSRADTTTDASLGPASAPAPTDEKGSIHGIVVDDSHLPVVGATVSLIEALERNSTTDEEGRFTFNDVVPGNHRLVAERLGFESLYRQAPVFAGETTHVEFRMVAIALQIPYHETAVLDGYFTLGAAVAGQSTRPGQTLFPDQDKSRIPTPLSQGESIKTLLDEMVWDSSAPLTSKKFRLQFVQDGGPVIHGVVGISPLIGRLDKEDGIGAKHLTHSVSVYANIDTNSPTGSAAVVMNQKFTIHFSRFYHEVGPEGFTALPP